MDLRGYVRVLRQRWWLVLAVVVVALGIGGALTVRAQPRYASTVTFFVNTPNQGVIDAYQGSLFTQERVKSYVDLLTSDRLAQSLASDPGIGLTADAVRQRIGATTQPNTVLLEATVTDTRQSRALKLTEALAKKFPTLVQQIETPPGAQQPTVKIEVVNGPRLNSNPVYPRPARNLALAGLLGLLLGVGAAVLREQLDNTVRSGAALQRMTSAPLLGQIPFDGSGKSAPLIVGGNGQSLRAEALRKLRTNLRFIDVQGRSQVIAVTSATQGEGKTTTCCNLAIALAEGGSRVLLVDADLRRPKVAHYLGLESQVGLTDVLIGDVEVGDALQQWGERDLYVLTSGSVPPNPSELLGSQTMAQLLDDFRAWADIVIIDTPPLLSVTDGAVVAVQADGTVLVTRYGKTTQAQITTAVRALQTVAARVLGCVLNMSKASKADAYYYKAYRVAVPLSRAQPRPVEGFADFLAPVGYLSDPAPRVHADPASDPASYREVAPVPDLPADPPAAPVSAAAPDRDPAGDEGAPAIALAHPTEELTRTPQ